MVMRSYVAFCPLGRLVNDRIDATLQSNAQLLEQLSGSHSDSDVCFRLLVNCTNCFYSVGEEGSAIVSEWSKESKGVYSLSLNHCTHCKLP